MMMIDNFTGKRGIPTPVKPSQRAIRRVEESLGPLNQQATVAERADRYRLWQAETIFCHMVEAGKAEWRPDGSIKLIKPASATLGARPKRGPGRPA